MASRKSSKDDDDDDDKFDTFHPSLWRMPLISPSIPSIAINEQEFKLEDFEPQISSQTQSSVESTINLGEIITTFQSETSKDGGSSSESNLNEKIIRDGFKNDETGIHNHLKFWRRKLLVLVWLNFLMRYRKRFSTFVEIFFPMIALGFICGGLVLNNTWKFNAFDEEPKLEKDNPFDAFNAMSKTVLFNYVCSNENICSTASQREFYIVYSPNNSFTKSLMEDMRVSLGLSEDTESSKLFGVPTPQDVHLSLQAQWQRLPVPTARYPAGIIFSFSDVAKDDLKEVEEDRKVPKKLKYTVRTYYPEISNTAENFPLVEHTSGLRTRHEVSPYIYTGFAGMQLAIDNAFLKKVSNMLNMSPLTDRAPGLDTNVKDMYENYVLTPHVRMFEYKFFLNEDDRLRVWTSVAIAFILSYACSNFIAVQDTCLESKSGQVELLKLHGLTPGLHWIAYGISSAVMRLLTTFLMALILHYCFSYHSLIKYQHPLIIWLFLFLHAVAQNFENFFFAHFFSRPTIGGKAIILKDFASFLLPMRLFGLNVFSRFPNMFLCALIPQWNLANGLYSYLQYEVYEEGLDWYDFPVLIDVNEYRIIPTQICCMLSIYSIAIFFLLTVYVDKVMAMQYSPGLSWLYCCKRLRQPKPETLKPSPPINYGEQPKVFEKPPSDLICTVRVRNLCKTYGTDNSYEIALDNISLDIHEGEITGIIGMSGSGKTSLIHAISGLIDPTSGYVEMKNLKVHEHSDFLNQFMSIVPQKCTLFPTLSTEDHVRFCCMIHGISYRKSKNQAKLLLQLFNLSGFKRHGHLWLSESHIKKLAMAMALASAPTILLLDEPCKGMDIESSNQFWKYLQSLKAKRTIIIASSRMQDAELYCDRLALMTKGKLVCYASPGKIRRQYGIGSVLNVREEGDEIDSDEVLKVINSEITGSILLSPIGYELLYRTHRYLLPFGQPYAALLERLEDEMENLGLSKVWVCRAEIDSIFYKISLSIGIESSMAAKECFLISDLSQGSIEFGDVRQDPPHIRESDLNPTAWKQFSALFTKKWLSMIQRDNLLINEFMVSFFLMILVMFFSNEFLEFKPESLAQPLHIRMYTNTFTPILPGGATSTQSYWFDAFTKALTDTPTEFLRVPDIVKYLEKGRLHHLGNFRKQTIVAFERHDSITVGYYSANSYHSCPIALNAMANSFLYTISDDKSRPYSIRISNFPEHQYEGFYAGSSQSNSTTIYAFMISIILALIAATELRLPILEKHKDIKTMQFMIGVHPTMYWYTSFAGDFARNAIVVAILMIIIVIIDVINQQFTGVEEKLILALVMFSFLCWSSIPYSYVISDLLNPTHLGYGHYLVLHFILGIFPKIITYQMLRTETEGFYFFLRYVLYVFPPYSITSALVHYLHIVTERNYCGDTSYESKCEDYEKGINRDSSDLENAVDFDPLFRSCCKAYCESEGICHQKRDFFINAPVPALRADMASMAFQGLFYWAILILMEHNVLQNILSSFTTRIFGNKEGKEAEEDIRDVDEPEDVKKEHANVEYMVEVEDNVESEVFLVQDVTKFYQADKVIDHAYFSTPTAKITGILGLSKSGMTVLLKLLTAQLLPTIGNIFMFNEIMTLKQRVSFSAKIGYCPQHNPSYPDLTGFQTLQLMGRLRGVPELQNDVQVNRWLDLFELDAFAHIRCKTYRPGALRRLCCAMAMIGNPKVLIFDHPTDGMDLAEHHIFWKAIVKAKDKGQTIIFTSPYADEIQRCAQKVIVLDKGAISAVGRLTDVFKSNARGFILSLRCRNQAFKKLNAYQMAAKIDQLRDHIIRHLSPCDLLMDQDSVLVYHLKDPTAKLSYTYGIMEGAREKFPHLIDHFHIAEPSLDDVVLNYHKSKHRHSNNESQRRRISEADNEDVLTSHPRRSNSV